MNSLEIKKIGNIVFEALGEVSMCWIPRPNKNIFDSTEAGRIGNELMSKINSHTKRVSIEFAEWSSVKGWVYNESVKVFTNIMYQDAIDLSSDDLYDLYIYDIKNNKG